ncbi:MAG: glutamyl-tRNA reductase [Ignavibacteriales bacterium]|nr:glutamyl-tRNA reductase [Ignavibacteriales bacterium]
MTIDELLLQMHDLILIGLNHKTASVELREKLYFRQEEIQAILAELGKLYFKEVVLLSTCNRTELVGIPANEPVNDEPLINYLIEKKSAHDSISRNHFYVQRSGNAVHHLFEVASGIDSLLIGEDQIIGQVRDAYELAVQNGTVGQLLHHLFHSAFHTSKRAKTETKINDGAVSVSYAAVELAEKIFDDLSKKRAMLIGAGETAELSAKNLAEQGINDIIIANRTIEKAEKLALEFKGKAIPLEMISEKLHEVDIVISSISVSEYVLNLAQVKKSMALRSSKPLLIVDIGVPRNIDPNVKNIDNVFLEDMDSLEIISKQNRQRRLSEIPKVQKIISEELHAFQHWYQSLEVTPTIKLLRDKFEAVRTMEIEKYQHRFSGKEIEHIDAVTKAIINKLLHTPTVNMKEHTNGLANIDKATLSTIVHHLFSLDKKET